MAIDLATLAALGILPSAASSIPSLPDLSAAQQPQLGPSAFPIQPDGTDPLAPLADNTKADASSTEKPSVGAPWKSDALLALGAGLLSGNNFFDGLAKGAMAAQEARHSWEQPKRNVLANGAFTLEQYPDGSTKLVPNKAIQDYQAQLATTSLLGKLDIAQFNDKAIADRMAANNKAQMDRTQAMISAEDRRAAAKNELDSEHYQQQYRIAQGKEANKETSFQKGVETAKGKQYAKLDDSYAQADQLDSELNFLLGTVADQQPDGTWKLNPKKAAANGIGVGAGMAAERGAMSTLPALASKAMGYNPDTYTEMGQKLKRLTANTVRQMVQQAGGGSRITNYDFVFTGKSLPNPNMTPQAFFNSIMDFKHMNKGARKVLDELKAEGDAKMHTPGSATAPVTSGKTSKGLSWQIVSH